MLQRVVSIYILTESFLVFAGLLRCMIGSRVHCDSVCLLPLDLLVACSQYVLLFDPVTSKHTQ